MWPNPNDSKVQLIFRGRCTQQWDQLDVERLLFPEQYILNNSIFNREFDNNDDDNDNNNNAEQYLEMNIELLRQMNQTETNNRKLNPINSFWNAKGLSQRPLNPQDYGIEIKNKIADILKQQ